jgi:hypothetical protein
MRGQRPDPAGLEVVIAGTSNANQSRTFDNAELNPPAAEVKALELLGNARADRAERISKTKPATSVPGAAPSILPQ